MNLIRLEAVKDGILYVAEAPMPDLKGYTGKMSTYCGLHCSVSRLLWALAAKIETGQGIEEESRPTWASMLGDK